MNFFFIICVLAFYSGGFVSCNKICRPTSPDIIGPYYYPKPPKLQQFCTRIPEHNQLKTLLVHGHVYKDDCRTPIPFVRMEIWQADQTGQYYNRTMCRGHFKTDKYGYYEVSTIHPGRYSLGAWDTNYRPAHLHFKVFGRRGHKSLVTQMYFAGDPYLGRNDSCSYCASNKQDLIVLTEDYCNDNDKTDCIQVAKFDIVLERGSGINIVTKS